MIAHSAEIIIYVIIGCLGSLFVTLAILNVRNERKHDMNYRKYVKSIQIGDTFGHNSFKFSDVDDPFSENHGVEGFDPQYHVTILDIKKNSKGETWVKYCFTRVLNKQHCEWTDEINDFLKYRTRISRRIDNINTSEE
jgi:hypothetical protein